MKCPFCQSRLKVWPDIFRTSYGCDNPKCEQDAMPRYIVGYNNYPTYLVTRTLMIDDCYIQIDYRNKCTVISKLIGYILLDSVQIPRALDIDLKNPRSIMIKIHTLMTFS
jgi:hypothetical protein